MNAHKMLTKEVLHFVGAMKACIMHANVIQTLLVGSTECSESHQKDTYLVRIIGKNIGFRASCWCRFRNLV